MASSKDETQDGTTHRSTMPTRAELQISAEQLMRDCAARSGEELDEATVRRQASKIVKSFYPSVRSAWHD